MGDATMFQNREDAGRQLAEQLTTLDLHDPLVLAIPRGGIVIGAEIARALGAELDVVLSRKLRAPGQPELAIGAVGEDGAVYRSPHLEWVPGATEEYLAHERNYQMAEITRRQQLFRSARPVAHIADRSVIVTDDGIATGSTMIAALRSIRARQPRELVVAVPVAAPSQLDRVSPHCDRLICLAAPEFFVAIGQFYGDFRQVEDSQVLELLREFAPTASA
jgi:predicted phosphoribosyltransferase